MDNRASTWSVTINNPVVADEENINKARQKGWIVDGQKEVGENGTPHYQLIVKTGQVRFSAVKSMFPRAHIEVARNVKALQTYVHKQDTRVSQLETQNEKYPSLQKVWDMFADYVQEFKGQHLNWTEKRWLNEFDRAIRRMIEDGYVVEGIAVNPQIRLSVKLYGEQIITRSIRRQTDRQTTENIVEVD